MVSWAGLVGVAGRMFDGLDLVGGVCVVVGCCRLLGVSGSIFTGRAYPGSEHARASAGHLLGLVGLERSDCERYPQCSALDRSFFPPVWSRDMPRILEKSNVRLVCKALLQERDLRSGSRQGCRSAQGIFNRRIALAGRTIGKMLRSWNPMLA